MKVYEVAVTRDGDWLMVAIPALDGLTQARDLGEVETMARDYIAATLGVPLTEVAVTIASSSETCQRQPEQFRLRRDDELSDDAMRWRSDWGTGQP